VLQSINDRQSISLTTVAVRRLLFVLCANSLISSAVNTSLCFVAMVHCTACNKCGKCVNITSHCLQILIHRSQKTITSAWSYLPYKKTAKFCKDLSSDQLFHSEYIHIAPTMIDSSASLVSNQCVSYWLQRNFLTLCSRYCIPFSVRHCSVHGRTGILPIEKPAPLILNVFFYNKGGRKMKGIQLTQVDMENRHNEWSK